MIADGLVILFAQAVGPDDVARYAEAVLALVAPPRRCLWLERWASTYDELQRGPQVGVSRSNNSDIVRVVKGEIHIVNREHNIDTLLLSRHMWLPVSRVTKRSRNNRCSCSLPSCHSFSVCSVPFWFPVLVCQAGVHPHFFEDARPRYPYGQTRCYQVAQINWVAVTASAVGGFLKESTSSASIKVLLINEDNHLVGHDQAKLPQSLRYKKPRQNACIKQTHGGEEHIYIAPVIKRLSSPFCYIFSAIIR